jgi:predicted RNA-binding Zn-ribbon protein involved in translation (DUF1610 family)
MSASKNLEGYCDKCGDKKKVEKTGDDKFNCLDCGSIVHSKYCSNCKIRVLPEDKNGKDYICPECHGRINKDEMRRQGVR